jgi:hypothetical protein
MHHADGNAANIGGLKKGEGGGWEKKEEKRGNKGRSFYSNFQE